MRDGQWAVIQTANIVGILARVMADVEASQKKDTNRMVLKLNA